MSEPLRPQNGRSAAYWARFSAREDARGRKWLSHSEVSVELAQVRGGNPKSAGPGNDAALVRWTYDDLGRSITKEVVSDPGKPTGQPCWDQSGLHSPMQQSSPPQQGSQASPNTTSSTSGSNTMSAASGSCSFTSADQ